MDTSEQSVMAVNQTPTRTRSGAVPTTPVKTPERLRDEAILNAPTLNLDHDPQEDLFDTMIALQSQHARMGETLDTLQRILTDLPTIEDLNTAESRDHRLRVLNISYRVFNTHLKAFESGTTHLENSTNEMRDQILDYLRARLTNVLTAGACDKELRALLQLHAYGQMAEIVEGVVDAVLAHKLGSDEAIDKFFKSVPLPKALEIMSKPKKSAPVEEEPVEDEDKSLEELL